MGRGFSWIDTGTHESLLGASFSIHTIQIQQNIRITCVEEIAFRKGFITPQKLITLAKLLEKNEYLDSLTYASLPKEIRTLTSDPRLSFKRGSIVYEKIIGAVVAQEPIVHFAAESYADNSIQKDKFGEYNFDANKVASLHSLRPLIQ